MPVHNQTWTKVNAPVDEGVQGIVAALSEFPSLETIESCEGNESKGPWVCFRFGEYWQHPWQQLATFVLGYLAPGLVAQVGDDVNVLIRVTPSGQIFGELSMRPGAQRRVEAALVELGSQFSAFQLHTMEYWDGTART